METDNQVNPAPKPKTKKPATKNIAAMAGGLGAVNFVGTLALLSLMAAQGWTLRQESKKTHVPSETVAALMQDPKRTIKSTQELVEYTYKIQDQASLEGQRKSEVGVVASGILAMVLAWNMLWAWRIIKAAKPEKDEEPETKPWREKGGH